MKVKYIHILLLLLFAVPQGYGQQINPFEIKSRIEQADSNNLTAISDPSEKVVSENQIDAKQEKIVLNEENNPFDISRDIESTNQNIVKEIPKQKIEEKEEVETKIDQNSVTSKKSGNFLFWLILLTFLLLAITLSLDRWYITKIFKSIFNYNLSNTMMRSSSGFNLIVLSLLYLLFILSLSIFCYLLLRHFAGFEEIKYYLYCLGGIAGIYIIRHATLSLMLRIFQRIPEIVQYSFSIATFNIAAGIVLLFPILLFAYGSELMALIAMYSGLFIFAAIYILRSLRGLLISLKYIINYPFHFFLYLCAFEIIPLMVMYKLIADFV